MTAGPESPISYLPSQSASQPVGQSVGRSVGRSDGRSVGRSFSQSCLFFFVLHDIHFNTGTRTILMRQAVSPVLFQQLDSFREAACGSSRLLASPCPPQSWTTGCRWVSQLGPWAKRKTPSEISWSPQHAGRLCIRRAHGPPPREGGLLSMGLMLFVAIKGK